MIFINPAHGGYDLGGGSNLFFKEKDLTLKISKYQAERLKELGVDACLVRTDDYFISLNDRITFINNKASENDLLISNHLNYGADQGTEIIYSIKTKNDLPNLLSANLKKVGQTVRNVYQKFDRTGLDFYDILKYPLCKNKLIIHYGFSDNDDDLETLIYHWMDLAEAIILGIAEYLKIPYSAPTRIIYVVKTTESVYDVAERYKMSPERIKKDNNLITDILYPGTELMINTK